jgi:hypothetical protein
MSVHRYFRPCLLRLGGACPLSFALSNHSTRVMLPHPPPPQKDLLDRPSSLLSGIGRQYQCWDFRYSCLSPLLASSYLSSFISLCSPHILNFCPLFPALSFSSCPLFLARCTLSSPSLLSFLSSLPCYLFHILSSMSSIPCLLFLSSLSFLS